jgi:hypothetical protein
LARNLLAHRLQPDEERPGRLCVDRRQRALAIAGLALRLAPPLLGARLFGAGRAKILLGPRHRLFQGRELALQGAQDVGRRFQLTPFALQPFDLADRGTPVEVAETVEYGQFLQRVEPRLQRLQGLLQVADAPRDGAHPRFDAARRRFQGGDLVLVGPAEHIARAIVDTVAVVLLVPVGARLDLSGPGDRLPFAAECVEAVAAGVVEPPRQFAFEPAIEAAVGLDRDLAHEGGGMQRAMVGAGAPALGSHTEIH